MMTSQRVPQSQTRLLMSRGWPPCMYLLVCALGVTCVLPVGAENYLIGLLTPWNASFEGVSGLTSASAVSIAIETIRDDPTISNNINLSVITMDTGCTSKMALGNAVEMLIRQKVDVFVGPPCSEACQPVAQLASFWNKPIISWMATDPDFMQTDIYSTLARTLGPFNKMGAFLVEILEAYNWQRVALVSSTFNLWLDGSKAIRKTFTAANLTLSYEANYNNQPTRGFMNRVLNKIKEEARVVILMCPKVHRRRFLLAAYDLGMTSGDYVFITTDMTPQDDISSKETIWMENDGRDWAARQAFESVFNIVLAKLRNTKVDDFRKDVTQRMRLPPWNSYVEDYISPEVDFEYGDKFAAFLHDAVYLYALAINETVAQGKDPRKGDVLMEAMKYKRFFGMSGWVILDENADREPDYWVMDMAPNGTFIKIAEIINKEAVADDIFNTRVEPPRWPGGKVGWHWAPPDTPPCGFRGELCIREPMEGWVIAISVIIPMVAVVLGVFISILVYRKVRFENGLREQSWRINWDDIEPVRSGKSKDGSSSLGGSMSDAGTHSDAESNDGSEGYQQGKSASHMQSMPSIGTGVGQLFTQVANYRGTMVSIKKVKKEHIQVTRTLLMEFNEIKDIAHENLNIFVGACIDPPNLSALWTYCSKGSLPDVLENDAIKLDTTFKFSFMTDMAKGLNYIHSSHLGSHGNMKSSNCLIDARWTLRITDYGLPTFIAGQNLEVTEHELYKRKLWTAPEILRENVPNLKGTQKGDVYSFAIICYEIIQRCEPYTLDNVTPRDIVNRVRNGESVPYRPPLPEHSEMGKHILRLIKKCWSEDVEERPKFVQIRTQLRKLTRGDINIVDNVLKMMEKYANNLEEIVEERTGLLVEEKKKTDRLLYKMLPATVAESLKAGMIVQPENYEQSSIYFSDIVGFTTIASDSTPMQIVDFLNDLYSCFDTIIDKHDVYKVETIGDAYMVVSGVPIRNGTRHAVEIANCALELLSSVMEFSIRHRPKQRLQLRIGLHTGPIVAGVVGVVMPRYCLFGDTVNQAARMESSGKPLGIHVSKQYYLALKDHKEFKYDMKLRGEVNVKGKGLQTTYWLLGREGYDQALPSFDSASLKKRPTMESLTMTDESHQKNAEISARQSSTDEQDGST